MEILQITIKISNKEA